MGHDLDHGVQVAKRRGLSVTEPDDADLPGFTDGHGRAHEEVDLEGPLEPLPREQPDEGPSAQPPSPVADADHLEAGEAGAAAQDSVLAEAPVPDAGPMPVSQLHLSTASDALDELLDGGLERDAITLVFGEGGSGKTNLALQCARQACAAGLRVAYVDTEGVSPQRMEQVFAGDPRADPDNILFFTPFTIREQEQMVEKTALLRGLGLIVVDSINMHYRLHIDAKDTEKEASASLFKQLHHLTGHARKHRIPVLVTGQVYGGEDETQPFARRVMEHMVKALVRFQKKPDGGRKATVLKHRSIEEGRSARFRIGPMGLE